MLHKSIKFKNLKNLLLQITLNIKIKQLNISENKILYKDVHAV